MLAVAVQTELAVEAAQIVVEIVHIAAAVVYFDLEYIMAADLLRRTAARKVHMTMAGLASYMVVRRALV